MDEIIVVEGTPYQLVARFDNSDPPQVIAVYMVPVVQGDVALYDTATQPIG